MAHEIERKFIVQGDAWRVGARAHRILQGYLASGHRATVRVRVTDDGAWLTIKGESRGALRTEYEYAVPRDDAESLLDLCERPLIEKVRHHVIWDGRQWEVDEFQGANAGLVLAEVELESEDAAVALPPWVEREVTGEARYYNVNLSKNPFRSWPETLQEGAG
jgi:CYTH domain-containing protein